MAPRRLASFPILLAAAACLAAGPAPAQDAVEDVLQLARQGKVDQAEEACRRILADERSTPELRAAVDLVRGESILTRALIQPDLGRQLDLLDESIGFLERCLRGKPSAAIASEARRGIDWRRHRKAARAVSSLRSEEAPARREELLRRCQDLCVALESHYQDRLRLLRDMPPTPELQVEAQEVHLDLGRALMEHGIIPGLDEDRRRRTLGEAIALLQEYQLDHCDTASAFEACWLEGQAQEGLEDQATAQVRFEDAALLQSRLREARLEPTEECLRTIRGARASLARLLVETGRTAEAIACVDRALSEDPEAVREDAGRVLRLIKAEALHRRDDAASARDLAEEVLREDPDGSTGAVAREKLRVWSADPRGRSGRGAAELIASADQLLERESWSQALLTLRRAVEACEGPEETGRLEPLARYTMGLAFQRLDRPLEAIAAFEAVSRRFPLSDLAPRACFEAARLVGLEESLSGSPADGARKEALLSLLQERWPNHPSARNVPILAAEKAEKDREYARAAELYAGVREDADGRPAALVGAGRCLYLEAAALREKDRSDDGLVKAKGSLARAEQALKEFFALSPVPAGDPEAARSREVLAFQATQWLCQVCLHEDVGKHRECLDLVESYSKELRRDDERMARIWPLRIRAYFGLGQTDEGLKLLEALFERFPDSQNVVPICRIAAVHLERVVEKLEAGEGQQETLDGYRRRIAKYNRRWVEDGLAKGVRIPSAEAESAAGATVAAARGLNRIPPGAVSFLDVPERTLRSPQQFADAAFLFALLAEGRLGKPAERDRLGWQEKLARSLAFGATEAGDWQKAQAQFSRIIASAKLLGPGDAPDLKVLEKEPSLLLVYIELGGVYMELARKGQKFQYDNAIAIFSNVSGICESGSKPWWIAKWLLLSTLFERGAGNDVRFARAIFDNLEKNFPDYDGDRFGIKARLLVLKGRFPRLAG